MSENSNFNNGNLQVTFPCISLLGIAFIILKLCKVIAWSWLWVLAPVWIPLCISIVIVILIIFIAACKK